MSSPSAPARLHMPPTAMPPLQRRYSVTGQNPPDDVGAVKSPKLQALDTSVQSTSCGLCESGQDSARTSSKRSATQLPSPSTPSSHGLPTKRAHLGLDDDAMLLPSFSDDESGFRECHHLSDLLFESDCASIPSSPPYASTTPSDVCTDDGSLLHYTEDLALSPPPTDDDDVPLPPTLLTLPPELRHQIYLYLPDLVLPYPLIYCLSTFDNKKQHPLASVSRQIRSEALAVFYSYNHWIIKLEFKIMYDAFQNWIIQLGEAAGHLRIVTVAVRGSLFKPRTSHSAGINPNGTLVNVNGAGVYAVEEYHPPDGDASFKIDLSEKYEGGRVEVVRNDGTKESGEKARMCLEKLVEGMWEKRRVGVLNGQDWVDMVDRFLTFTGWW
ncbi:hypothetical protein EJ04DRAFT_511292 [Polyplosphaeria fusca]|uniref:F-box domain-containing protein n=1 Tax=Polyplosphaeria fusca TaxID=682080 RepID=A0A9P4R3L9_9PLEO|nr:hypothetical protein EJ04DRAFT_511292 [Polyplosphaeria fusca]